MALLPYLWTHDDGYRPAEWSAATWHRWYRQLARRRRRLELLEVLVMLAAVFAVIVGALLF